ncbi:MAG: aminotransferase class I/II-fold pyridoxal phosphate-dependent enzyme [Myxococcota bacterium]
MTDEFFRIGLLPPYVFAEVEEMKAKARAAGRDVIDFGLGNPDGAAPAPIVDRLIEAARDGRNHRYQPSKGLPETRAAIAGWYARRFGVSLDAEREAVATIGSKEGIAHLLLAIVGPGDAVVVPGPTYPVHHFGVIIAGGEPVPYGIGPGRDHLEEISKAIRRAPRKPKGLIVCFPHNPTSACEERGFFEKVVGLAREHGLWLISDLAYADLTFDGFRAPSLLEIPGAKEVGVEFFTCSKSFNMPGFRIGFCVGNARLCGALARIKTYLDYGIFAPIQAAAVKALAADSDAEVAKIREIYRKRRDVLCAGLARAGWKVDPPRATMFVWARIPERFGMTSMAFSKWLLEKADVSVAPGEGFGSGGEAFVRLALIEDEARCEEAARRIGKALG